MRTLKSTTLLAFLILSIALAGCQAIGGKNQIPDNDPIEISINQILGFWESKAQAVGFTGYFYRFFEDGSLALYEETQDNLVLDGTFSITGTSMDVVLNNPTTSSTILTMEWQLINVEPNELVFRTIPEEAIIWLSRVR